MILDLKLCWAELQLFHLGMEVTGDVSDLRDCELYHGELETRLKKIQAGFHSWKSGSDLEDAAL